MNNFRIKDFMNWKVALFVFMVCISIWVGTSMRTESSFLETVGGRNAANQKLMIVDQSTGEISFVKKSLTGINQNFTKEDNEIKEALKEILGNNLKGNSSGFIKELKDSIAAEAKNSTDTYATKTALAANRTLDDQRLKSLEDSIVARQTASQARTIAVQVVAAHETRRSGLKNLHK